MASEGVTPRDFETTLATLREGVINVALDRAREQVDGRERRLRAADDRQLTPIADNLAALHTELDRDDIDDIDGVTLSGLLTTLAGQVSHVSREGTEAESAAPVAGRLEVLAKLLEVEGRNLAHPSNEP